MKYRNLKCEYFGKTFGPVKYTVGQILYVLDGTFKAC